MVTGDRRTGAGAGRAWIGLAVVLLAALVVAVPVPVHGDGGWVSSGCAITRTLRLGSVGSQVKCAERTLRSKGYGGFKLDNRVGPATVRQIERYQADHGLEVTGVVGAQTATHLGIWGQPLPPDGSCTRVNMVGDSMAVSMNYHLEDLSDRWDIPITVTAAVSRRTDQMVSMIRQLRTRVGDTRCWVIVGGSNDAGFVWAADSGRTGERCGSSPARRAEARQRIDRVLRTIGKGRRHQVFWVNISVNDLASASCIWNTELETFPRVEVIDWHSLVEANPRWFLDNVHTNATGNLRRARLVARAIR